MMKVFYKNSHKTYSKFYKYLHNGFFDLDYDDMGIMPLENVECLDEYEWGIIEDMKLDLRIDLSTSYSFFSNGSGGYDCY